MKKKDSGSFSNEQKDEKMNKTRRRIKAFPPYTSEEDINTIDSTNSLHEKMKPFQKYQVNNLYKYLVILILKDLFSKVLEIVVLKKINLGF
jgi:hypothetical protein